MCKKWIAAVVFISLLGTSGCFRRKLRKYHDARALMGTQVSITVFSEDGQKAAFAMNAAFARISQLEALLSKHRPDSDIGRLNTARPGKLKVSPETFIVINKAIEFGKITQGAFDMTVEPLLKLWEQTQGKNSPPTQDAINRALSRMGHADIVLHPESSEIELKKMGVSVDVGGIAKGYIVGEAVQALKSNGIGHGLVTAGGDMYALGKNPERGPWLIGIRNPLKPEENLRYIEVTDKAVATSGHYMRFYNVGGKRYSHIVDPRTGYPARNEVVSVTLIGPDGTATDALTKAAIVLGPEKGLAIIATQPGIEALVMAWDGSRMSYFQSPGFARYLSAQ